MSGAVAKMEGVETEKNLLKRPLHKFSHLINSLSFRVGIIIQLELAKMDWFLLGEGEYLDSWVTGTQRTTLFLLLLRL